MKNLRFAIATFAIVTVALAAGGEAGRQTASPKDSAPNATMSVTIVGSGGGPAVNLQRFGPSILVRAGSETLLFDCGRGATLRLAQLGVPLENVRQLFLTHLHSDHIIDIPDLLLTPWAGPAARQQPFEVWGPDGTEVMMRRLQEAFAFDIHVRRDIDEKFSKEGITVRSHDIHEGPVFERNGVRVTAFLVDHGPVKPAFGYRVDYMNRSFAMSGDTRFSENLIKFAQGVDLLIHEATAGDVNRSTNQTREQVENIIAHHTLPEQAGEVFSRVKPKLAIYAHAPVSAALITRTRTTYQGPLETGEDMMTIEIGPRVEVRRFSR
jgi:ribonuclease Z